MYLIMIKEQFSASFLCIFFLFTFSWFSVLCFCSSFIYLYCTTSFTYHLLFVYVPFSKHIMSMCCFAFLFVWNLNTIHVFRTKNLKETIMEKKKDILAHTDYMRRKREIDVFRHWIEIKINSRSLSQICNTYLTGIW